MKLPKAKNKQITSDKKFTEMAEKVREDCSCHCHVDVTICGCCCGGNNCRFEIRECKHCTKLPKGAVWL